jgi:hypothetical protein
VKSLFLAFPFLLLALAAGAHPSHELSIQCNVGAYGASIAKRGLLERDSMGTLTVRQRGRGAGPVLATGTVSLIDFGIAPELKWVVWPTGKNHFYWELFSKEGHYFFVTLEGEMRNRGYPVAGLYPARGNVRLNLQGQITRDAEAKCMVRVGGADAL